MYCDSSGSMILAFPRPSQIKEVFLDTHSTCFGKYSRSNSTSGHVMNRTESSPRLTFTKSRLLPDRLGVGLDKLGMLKAKGLVFLLQPLRGAK